jgi:hypothetical protein
MTDVIFGDDAAIKELQKIANRINEPKSEDVDIDSERLLTYLGHLAEQFEMAGRDMITKCSEKLRDHFSDGSQLMSTRQIEIVLELIRQRGQHQAKKFIFNSLVGLAIEWEWVEDATQTGIGIFSGMIAEFGDEWFWVTAGHIYENVFKQVEKGVLQIRQLRIVDGAGLTPLTSDGFTIDLELCDHAFFYSEENGLDIGFVHMRQNYRDLLAANGIRPVPISMWASNSDDDAAVGYALVGFPDELKVEHPESFTLKAEFISVVRTNQPTKSLDKVIPRFHAQVPRLQEFSSIVGMSGGPIIKFRFKDDNLYFWIVGVQNGWDEKARVLAACPAEVLVAAFKTWIVECERE